MGGDLTAAPDGKSPALLIRALRDADGANLDRIQIVKGWLDEDGKTQEKVYDVAWSGDRKPGADGKVPAVGNTVKISSKPATPMRSARRFLQAYWRDPAFDPTQKCLLLRARPRDPHATWTTYDAKVFGVELPKDVPASIQERAYTTPIWYTPQG